MKNFWNKLNKPIHALAPMAGITDSAFRQICKEFGADVVYSEMASVSALFYNPKKTLEMLEFSPKERPYVVQLFGSNPKHFAKAAKLLTDKQQSSKFPRLPRNGGQAISPPAKAWRAGNFKFPDGIDINFGCPVKKVIKQGAGAALMQNFKLSREVIKSVINNTDLPVSIKLRSKSGNIDCLQFLDYMKDLDIKAVMIHGRTLAQGFSGPVDAEIIKKARDCFGGIILANGGVMDYQDAQNLLNKTETDGVGIARGALGKPWIFKQLTIKNYELSPPQRDPATAGQIKELFKVAIRHAKLAEKLKGKQGIIEMRKHLCWYVHGLPGACEMRQKLVQVKTIEDIKKILK